MSVHARYLTSFASILSLYVKITALHIATRQPFMEVAI
jgi:hypothetical protein